MKKVFALGVAVGLMSLSACNNTPREQAAENIEANAEAVAHTPAFLNATVPLPVLPNDRLLPCDSNRPAFWNMNERKKPKADKVRPMTACRSSVLQVRY